MLRSLLTTMSILAMPGIASAGICQDEIAKLTQALAEAQEIEVGLRNQIEDMRTQAVNLCEAGNVQESVDVLSDARALLEGE